jgi:hypothetical protein
MRIIRTLLHQRLTTALLALAVLFAGWQCPARAQEFTPDNAWKTQGTPAGRVVWQHVGRVYLNPSNGQFVYAGYLVHIDAIDSSLFNGSPSESTAYFTFSTGVAHPAQLTPLPPNNDVDLALVSEGTFNVYYNAVPSGDWSNPASFSSGKLVATFARKESLLVEIGPVGFHNLSETLMSSHNFNFDGKTYNFERIALHGITFSQFFSTAPQVSGVTDFPAALAVAGVVWAVGTPEERH